MSKTQTYRRPVVSGAFLEDKVLLYNTDEIQLFQKLIGDVFRYAACKQNSGYSFIGLTQLSNLKLSVLPVLVRSGMISRTTNYWLHRAVDRAIEKFALRFISLEDKHRVENYEWVLKYIQDYHQRQPLEEIERKVAVFKARELKLAKEEAEKAAKLGKKSTTK